MTLMDRHAAAVIDEAQTAQERYGDFSSTHEAYGVLAEEVAELLEAVRSNDLLKIGHEARQVAAVALRLSEHCGRAPEPFRKRSGAK